MRLTNLITTEAVADVLPHDNDAAVAAVALHRGGAGAPLATEAKAGATAAEGYRLSPHVLQYYETTKA